MWLLQRQADWTKRDPENLNQSQKSILVCIHGRKIPVTPEITDRLKNILERYLQRDFIERNKKHFKFISFIDKNKDTFQNKEISQVFKVFYVLFSYI